MIFASVALDSFTGSVNRIEKFPVVFELNVTVEFPATNGAGKKENDGKLGVTTAAFNPAPVNEIVLVLSLIAGATSTPPI